MNTSRREFLKRSGTAGALFSVPMIWNRSSALAGDLNSRPTVAAIGVGGSRGRYNQGGAIARRAAKLGKMIACCDVDDRHTAEFNASFDNKLSLHRDYRDLLEKNRPDVVTIGTPDHWHAPMAIAALHAGCDVYCEKPLTLTIQEGIDIRQVVKETGRVFQVGTQQRSENDSRFLKAIAIVQSGRLGKNVNAYVAVGGAPGEGPFPSVPAPSDLDWKMWVGPAPPADYCEERRKMFRWWFEYSGGKMTDWGAHHIDIAQWALGHDHSGPVKASGTCSFPSIIPDNFNWAAFLDGEQRLPNGFNTASKFNVQLTFADGAMMSVNDHYRRDDGRTDFDNGILFEGDEGRIFVNRGKLEGKPVQDLTEADQKELNERIVKLYKGKKPGSHMANFFSCLEDREQPVADVDTHHRTMTSCHLCNITLMLGRELSWDPVKEQFAGDDQANALTTRRSHGSFTT